MAPEAGSDIVLVSSRIDPSELERLLRLFFRDMVKFVVDVERGVAAVGGELHADAEARLLALGSCQESLWGGNYFPARPAANCIEFTSMINIRPSQGNPAMEVQSPVVRARMRELVHVLLGSGAGEA